MSPRRQSPYVVGIEEALADLLRLLPKPGLQQLVPRPLPARRLILMRKWQAVLRDEQARRQPSLPLEAPR